MDSFPLDLIPLWTPAGPRPAIHRPRSQERLLQHRKDTAVVIRPEIHAAPAPGSSEGTAQILDRESGLIRGDQDQVAPSVPPSSSPSDWTTYASLPTCSATRAITGLKSRNMLVSVEC